MSHPVPFPYPTAATVKQQLLQLTPSQAAIEWLIERLPRQRCPIALQPVQDIEIKNEAAGAYFSTGQCPRFSVLAGVPLSEGWYYLETAITRSNGHRYAEIQCHLNPQPGLDEAAATCIPVSSNLRGSVREVIYLPKGVKSMHWVPTKARGFFSQSPILLHKISGLESGLRRWHRVLSDLWRYRRTPAFRCADLTLKAAQRNLQSAYNASTLWRLRQTSGFDYTSYLAERAAQNKHRAAERPQEIRRAGPVAISAILVATQSDLPLLRTCLDSLKQQHPTKLELLLVGEWPDDLVSQYQNTEPIRRIRHIQLGSTTLAAQLNAAIHTAAGDYILRMSPSYTLSDDGLQKINAQLCKSPSLKVLYFDNDTINLETGARSSPQFRPDWNPELLHSHCYVGECLAYSKELLRKIGGYRQGVDGAEDYDLILRASQVFAANEVEHLGDVVFHRQSMAPTDKGTEAHRHEAAKRALQDHLKSFGAAVTDGAGPGLFRPHYPLPSVPPLVSIIVPTRDRVDLLKACVKSIQTKTEYPDWEIVIVDNDSIEAQTIEYLKTVQQDRRIKVLHCPGPFNYSDLNNRAAHVCQGEVLVLLNNDIEVIAPNWLNELVSHAIRPGVGAVGAKLLYADNTVQHAGVMLGMGGVAGHVHRFIEGDAPGYCHRAVVAQNLSAVTGACLAVVKDRFLKVNGLDENLAVAFNDIDLCLRLLDAGMRNTFTPWALLYHHESLSRGTNDTPQKQAIFDREWAYMKTRWADRLSHDPAWGTYFEVVKRS